MNPLPFLVKKSKQLFYNISPLDIEELMGDQDNIAENVYSYIRAFSEDLRDVLERFRFHLRAERFDKAGLPYLVTK